MLTLAISGYSGDVFATGEIVKSGSRTVKCVTGYNLAGLMVQSEGTLGVISEAVLKLVPPPQASKALMAVFSDVQHAADAVAESPMFAMRVFTNSRAYFISSSLTPTFT